MHLPPMPEVIVHAYVKYAFTVLMRRSNEPIAHHSAVQ